MEYVAIALALAVGYLLGWNRRLADYAAFVVRGNEDLARENPNPFRPARTNAKPVDHVWGSGTGRDIPPIAGRIGPEGAG